MVLISTVAYGIKFIQAMAYYPANSAGRVMRFITDTSYGQINNAQLKYRVFLMFSLMKKF